MAVVFSISSFKSCAVSFTRLPSTECLCLLFPLKPSGMSVLSKWSNQVFILNKYHNMCILMLKDTCYFCRLCIYVNSLLFKIFHEECLAFSIFLRAGVHILPLYAICAYTI